MQPVLAVVPWSKKDHSLLTLLHPLQEYGLHCTGLANMFFTRRIPRLPFYPATGLCMLKRYTTGKVAPRLSQSPKSAYAAHARLFCRSRRAPQLIYFARPRFTFAHHNSLSGQDRLKSDSLPCIIYNPYFFDRVFLFIFRFQRLRSLSQNLPCPLH